MRGKIVTAAALATVLSLGSAMGSMAAYWEPVGTSDWKYVKDDGKYAASEWVAHTDGNSYYLKDDTLMAKGWILDPTDNHWYFTDSTGALVSGLIEVSGNAYYMNEVHDGTFGALYVGQKTIDGVTYNFTDNGTTNGKPSTSKKYNTDGTVAAAAAGAHWESVGTSDWKYVKADGKYAASEWVEHTDGNWYYLKDDTLMAKGWVLDPADNHWYFTDSTGAMVSGLIEVSGNVYYMNESHDGTFGALFVGQKVVNGVTYNFTDNGTTNGKPSTSKKYNTDGTAVATTRSSGSYSGGSSGGSGSSSTGKLSEATVDAVTEGQKNALTQLGEETVAGDEPLTNLVELPEDLPAPAKNTTTDFTVTLKQPVNEGNVNKMKEAATKVYNTMLDAIEDQVKDNGETVDRVTITVPADIEGPNGEKLTDGVKEFNSVEEAKTYIDRLIQTWVTPAMYNMYKGMSATIALTIGNDTVSYKVSLDNPPSRN